jgi:hypothetical protein
MASAAFPRFTVEPNASDADLRRLFEHIGEYCKRTSARGVAVRVLDHPALSGGQLLAGVESLAHAGCSEGFKVAWISANREMFDQLVHTEYAITHTGIRSRTFVDETGADRWLSW